MSVRKNSRWLVAGGILFVAAALIWPPGANAGSGRQTNSPKEIYIGESFVAFGIPACSDIDIVYTLLSTLPDLKKHGELVIAAYAEGRCRSISGRMIVEESVSTTEKVFAGKKLTLTLVRLTWQGKTLWSYTQLPVFTRESKSGLISDVGREFWSERTSEYTKISNVRPCFNMGYVKWLLTARKYTVDLEVITDHRVQALADAVNDKPPKTYHQADTAVVAWHPDGHVAIILVKDGCANGTAGWSVENADKIRAILNLKPVALIALGWETIHHKLSHQTMVVGSSSVVNVHMCDTTDQVLSIVNAHQNDGPNAGIARWEELNRARNQFGEPVCQFVTISAIPTEIILKTELKNPDASIVVFEFLARTYRGIVHFAGMIVGVDVITLEEWEEMERRMTPDAQPDA